MKTILYWLLELIATVAPLILNWLWARRSQRRRRPPSLLGR